MSFPPEKISILGCSIVASKVLMLKMGFSTCGPSDLFIKKEINSEAILDLWISTYPHGYDLCYDQRQKHQSVSNSPLVVQKISKLSINQLKKKTITFKRHSDGAKNS